MTRLGILIKKIVKRITDTYKNSLVDRLILFTAVILSLAIISITVISSAMIRKQSTENLISNGSNNLKIVNNDIDEYFSQLENASFPNHYEQFCNAIRYESVDYNQQICLMDYISNIYHSRIDIDKIEVEVFPQNKSYYMYASDINGGVHINYRKTPMKQLTEKNCVNIIPISDQQTKQEAQSNGNFMQIERHFTPIGQANSSALITLTINKKQITKNFSNILSEKGDHVIMLSPDNSLFYNDNDDFYYLLKDDKNFSKIKATSKAELNPFTITLNNQNYLVIYNVSSTTGNKLIRLVLYDNINKSANLTTTLCFLIGIFLMVVSILLITIIARKIAQPLERLSKEINKFGKGDLTVKTEVKGTDEIANLQKQFNKMSDRINMLINEHYSLTIAEKNAELKALQAEVNPHFIYNALQAISTTALKCGAFDVSDMIGSFAQSMRYCISGSDLVTVKDELVNVNNYLVLQKARFRDKLNIVYKIDENSKTTVIPKLSLQTLVDNSIKYAKEKMTKGITIEIKAQCVDDYVIMSVSDDGPGMTRDRLSEILQFLSSDKDDAGGKAIGLKNLNSRLRIVFGFQSQLYIISGKYGTRTFFAVKLNKQQS